MSKRLGENMNIIDEVIENPIINSADLTPESPTYNYIDLWVKVGDQETAEGSEHLGFKDGMPIQIINPNVDNFIVSDDMKRIFSCIRLPLAMQAEAATWCIPNQFGDNIDKSNYRVRSKLFNFKELELATGIENLEVDLRSKKTVDIIDCSNLDVNSLVKDSAILNAPAKDLNAWVGGAVTFGSGGTYLTIVLMAADAGTFTSSGTATLVSSITETSFSNFANNIGIYDLTITGDWINGVSATGYTISSNYNVTFTLFWSGSGSGTFSVKNTKWIALASVEFLRVNSTSTHTGIFEVKDNFFDMAAFSSTQVLRVSQSSVCVRCSNNIVVSSRGTAVKIDASGGHADSIYEGNFLFDCTTGFDFVSEPGKAQDNYTSGTTCYSNTGGLSVYSKCASSDATGSEVGLQSLAAATVFQSVTPTDANFGVPVFGGALNGTGVNPLIITRTFYYNGIPIVLGDVDIGAKGLARDIAAKINYYRRLRI